MMLEVRSKVFFGKSLATAPVTCQNLGNQCLRAVGGLKSYFWGAQWLVYGSRGMRRGVLMMLEVRSKVFFGKSPATAPVTYQNLGNQCLRTVGGLESCFWGAQRLV